MVSGSFKLLNVFFYSVRFVVIDLFVVKRLKLTMLHKANVVWVKRISLLVYSYQTFPTYLKLKKQNSVTPNNTKQRLPNNTKQHKVKTKQKTQGLLCSSGTTTINPVTKLTVAVIPVVLQGSYWLGARARAIDLLKWPSGNTTISCQSLLILWEWCRFHCTIWIRQSRQLVSSGLSANWPPRLLIVVISSDPILIAEMQC